MQRGPRRTHAGWGETQGLQAGTKGSGFSGRAAGPLCPRQAPKAPHHALPIYRVPSWPCCALAPGERGEGEGAGEREMRRGPILDTTPVQQNPIPAGGGSVAEPAAQGRLFPSPASPPRLRLGWGCATLLQVAAQQTPVIGPREEEEEGLWAVPDPNTQHLHTAGFLDTSATADTSLLIPPGSAGRGWAHQGRDEKLSGEETGRKRQKGQ